MVGSSVPTCDVPFKTLEATTLSVSIGVAPAKVTRTPDVGWLASGEAVSPVKEGVTGEVTSDGSAAEAIAGVHGAHGATTLAFTAEPGPSGENRSLNKERLSNSATGDVTRGSEEVLAWRMLIVPQGTIGCWAPGSSVPVAPARYTPAVAEREGSGSGGSKDARTEPLGVRMRFSGLETTASGCGMQSGESSAL